MGAELQARVGLGLIGPRPARPAQPLGGTGPSLSLMRPGPAILIGIAAVVLAGCSASDDAGTTAAPAVTPVASPADQAGVATRPTGGFDDDPAETDASSLTRETPVFPEGFERVRATVSTSDGSICELCLWLAETEDQRRQGLMGVTDLGPADGMAFVYPRPRTGNFWMKDTVLPLSIAFFGSDGGFLSSFDMEPCTTSPCPLYRTARDFVVAIETVQGRLAADGLVAGNVLALTDLPCDD